MIIGARINKHGLFASFGLSILFFVIGIVIAATSVNMITLIIGGCFKVLVEVLSLHVFITASL